MDCMENYDMELVRWMNRSDRLEWHERRVRRISPVLKFMEKLQDEDMDSEELTLELEIVRAEMSEIESLIAALESTEILVLMTTLEDMSKRIRRCIAIRGDLLVRRYTKRNRGEASQFDGVIRDAEQREALLFREAEGVEMQICQACKMLGTDAKPFLRVAKLRILQ